MTITAQELLDNGEESRLKAENAVLRSIINTLEAENLHLKKEKKSKFWTRLRFTVFKWFS